MIELRQVFSHEANRLGMQMGARLRAGDAAECAAAGLSGYDAVTTSVRASAFAFGAFDGGTPLGLWGLVTTSMVGDTARAWFLTAQGTERHRKLLLRQSREFVQFAEGQYPRLEAYVHRDYNTCIRWLRWLGFTVGDPVHDLFDGGFCRATIGF